MACENWIFISNERKTKKKCGLNENNIDNRHAKRACSLYSIITNCGTLLIKTMIKFNPYMASILLAWELNDSIEYTRIFQSFSLASSLLNTELRVRSAEHQECTQFHSNIMYSILIQHKWNGNEKTKWPPKQVNRPKRPYGWLDDKRGEPAVFNNLNRFHKFKESIFLLIFDFEIIIFVLFIIRFYVP